MEGSDYITIGYNFLGLVTNCVDEMEFQGNSDMIISRVSEIQGDGWEEYEQKTKWNDNNIAIPILFNYFHGIELMLKGLILRCGGKLETKHHKLSDLYVRLIETPYPPTDKVLRIFHSTIHDNVFKDFFNENEETTDKFFELFKYPESIKGNHFSFGKIQGQNQLGLEKFKILQGTIDDLKNEIKNWLKKTEPHNG